MKLQLDQDDRAVVVEGGTTYAGIWRDEAGRRWFHSNVPELLLLTMSQHEEILELFRDHEDELERHGLPLRSFWFLWPCPACGVPALGPCLSLRDQSRNKRCHRARKPRPGRRL